VEADLKKKRVCVICGKDRFQSFRVVSQIDRQRFTARNMELIPDEALDVERNKSRIRVTSIQCRDISTTD